jgi:trehalose 6-phosphate synthase
MPLVMSTALVSLLFAFYQVEAERRTLRRDLGRRAEVLAESLRESIEPYFKDGPDKHLDRIVERFGRRAHLTGIAVYSDDGALLDITPGLPDELRLRPHAAEAAERLDTGSGEFITVEQAPVHVFALPLHRDGKVAGTLVLIHDAEFIDAQTGRMWRASLLNATAQTLLISVVALLLIRLVFLRPLARTAGWLRARRLGHTAAFTAPPDSGMFGPLAQEVTHLARNLDAARASAEEEARLRDTSDSLWTAERLRVSVRSKVQDSSLFVVSNREPYMHVRTDRSTEVLVPASGVVTALEPVLVACDGTWIAHGSGDADRDAVDANDRLRVPPESPRYSLRRVWLSKEEEQGYYYGFANEGLWPLCHTAYARPIFRPEDWDHYRRVNRRFADAVLAEMEGSNAPILLAQDYHLALLPGLVKEARPDARVAIFWHIPWPNPEVFGICPWQKELLDALLAADLVGFHTQFHCNNFLESVDRGLEALTEWDRFVVNRQGHLTWVRPFPISVAFPEAPESTGPKEGRAALLKELGIEAAVLCVGVDRVDYTKGILERFRAVEKFLDTWPSYQRQLTLVQIGAPSRTEIPAYRNLLGEVAAEAERINARFQAGRWKPIVLLKKHHGHRDINRLYRAADVCLVSSLHDGMNLVAKEFVAARHDERGVLILSKFAGAARELLDALIVNPYDIRQFAEAIRAAVQMPSAEQEARMRRMRRVVREQNIYRWAGNLLSDLCEIRLDSSERPRKAPLLVLPARAGAL